MDPSIASFGFAGLAGLLSILSPCVLPILPILLTSASNQHRLGPFALAAGLALSFAVIGTAIAALGNSLGVDPGAFKTGGAILLGVFGVILLSASLQQRFASATSGIGNAGHVMLSRLHLDGAGGQFVIGLVLGVVWSPCVGPTLGAAITLASQSTALGQVALTMAIFGLGAALPVVLLGWASRAAFARHRGSLARVSRYAKLAMGFALVVVSIAMVSGLDKKLEVVLIEHSPAWLTELTTRY
ncbi:cytochrome c biogenesis CcdA family protein [Massilia psychrophila]|jgi:cytochrome c biogenesis protein CcdA|uniref:Cytochrome C biogenesis protein n=1 Tax=Massilia psychrophila TaxID=1603353 RepID=A0A2G8SWB2_9BURK|nr:cytochrome c biogenesis CcdA family protein [Massilia psychrophila]PIL38086.1 cytochrome C biogenesis protein [Massilia psychrophila]GGE88084.1 cytochrome C biogenesis protein CcdA [Massilia psychrophila]